MKRKFHDEEEDAAVNKFLDLKQVLSARDGVEAGAMYYEHNDRWYLGNKIVERADSGDDMSSGSDFYTESQEATEQSEVSGTESKADLPPSANTGSGDDEEEENKTSGSEEAAVSGDDGESEEEESESEEVDEKDKKNKKDEKREERGDCLRRFKASLRYADEEVGEGNQAHGEFYKPDKVALEIDDRTHVLIKRGRFDRKNFTEGIDILLPTLQRVCEPAKFGDMKTNTTVHDPAVRSALSTRSFNLMFGDANMEPAEMWLTKKIANTGCWKRVRDLTVKPHALNVYLPGDHFEEHLDTQRRPDMVGTVSVIIGDFEGGQLTVVDPSGGRGQNYGPWHGMSIIGMLASCPHRVNVVKSGVRISITFDVFGELLPVPKTFHDDILAEADRVLAVFKRAPAVGVMLHHMYTANDIEKGVFRAARDDSLVKAVGDRGICTQLFWARSITQRYEASSTLNDNTVFSLNSDYKAFRDAIIFSGKEDPERCGQLLLNTESSAGFTGNDACEGEDDKVYRMTILMIGRKASAPVGTTE